VNLQGCKYRTSLGPLSRVVSVVPAIELEGHTELLGPRIAT
jgi:hypothetical protein